MEFDPAWVEGQVGLGNHGWNSAGLREAVSTNPTLRRKGLLAVGFSSTFAFLLLGARAFEYFGHWTIGHGGLYATAIYLRWICVMGGCLIGWVLIATWIDHRSGGGSFRRSALAILLVIGVIGWIGTHLYR